MNEEMNGRGERKKVSRLCFHALIRQSSEDGWQVYVCVCAERIVYFERCRECWPKSTHVWEVEVGVDSDEYKKAISHSRMAARCVLYVYAEGRNKSENLFNLYEGGKRANERRAE